MDPESIEVPKHTAKDIALKSGRSVRQVKRLIAEHLDEDLDYFKIPRFKALRGRVIKNFPAVFQYAMTDAQLERFISIYGRTNSF